MERIKDSKLESKPSTRVWSVVDFAKRNDLHKDSERQLRQLFGSFATASELQHNLARKPRWR